MFTISLKGGKAFAAEQKIRELKSRISKLTAISDKQKAKIPSVTIIKQSAENMNNPKREKYGISPNVIEEILCPEKDLGHYLILKGWNHRNMYQIDLINMIEKNMLTKRKNT